MQVHVTGVHPKMDGVYPLELDDLTNRELHAIYRISDVTVMSFAEAWVSQNAAFKVAVAAVAIGRADKYVDEDELWDAKGDAVRFEFPEVEAAVPPAQGPNDAENESSGTSGAGSSVSSVLPEPDPSPTGAQMSPTPSAA